MRRRVAKIYHFAVWLVLRGCFIVCSRKEVRGRAYRPRTAFKPLPPHITASSGSALALAKDLYDAEDERIRNLDDKARSLLSATSILFTLNGGLIALTASWDIGAYRWLLCAAFAFLLVTLFLLLGVFFGINSFSQPKIDRPTVLQLEQGHQHGLIRDYMEAAWKNALVREFLIDSYRAARRVFLCSMLLLGTAGLVVLFTDKPTEAVVQRLLNNPEFIRKVQGAKGDPGRPGPPGPIGPKGDPGPTGPARIQMTPSTQGAPPAGSTSPPEMP